ncbi:MAG: SPOR domain-containing protein [Oxalobacter sp.]|nr:MAG: SPOR domain-containing protein [Oxalobacter sp.]
MLKLIFWSLLLVNAALFAFRLGYLDSLMVSKTESERLAKQLNVDKLKIVKKEPAGQTPSPTSVTPPLAATSAPLASAPPVAPAAPPKVQARPPKLIPCTEVGEFVLEEAKKIEPRLLKLVPGERFSKRTRQEVVTYMVHIPPQSGKAAAEKKAGELKALGVKNFFIIQDNSTMRWGISLGVFKSEAAAKRHLESLKKQGVRSARVGPRSVADRRYTFVLRDLDDASLKTLDNIMRDFPEQEAQACGTR